MSQNQRFVQLHVHSHYSLLDGLGKIPDLVKRAKALGMDALALTDHGVLYGAIEFYKTCQAEGIKPIIGIEAYISPRGMNEREPRVDSHASHLILLAKNKAGYKNLIKLTTAAHLQGFYYKPRVDREFLAAHAEGLIALSACINGVVAKHLRYETREAALKEISLMQTIFGADNFYLEIQPHFNFPDQVKINKQLLELAKQTGAPLVATNDIHYILPEDKDAHEVLLAVQQGKDVDDQERLSLQDVHLAMYSPEEMITFFQDVPEAIENTVKIAAQCDLKLHLGETIIPHFDVPKGETLESFLRIKCDEGLKHRYQGTVPKEVMERLEYELQVIKDAGFPGYFLIVADLVNAARERGISTNTRGSAAGSLVSYLTRITDIDPFRYKLVFERFLNPERISPPDVDLDIADTRRGEMIEYLVQKYGSDHVAQIITFGTMAARGAVRDTGRALGMAYLDVDRIAKLVPFGLTLEQALNESQELALIYKSESETKRLLDMARRLEGVARHASTHAAGIVVSKEPLTEYVPLQHAARADQTITTQYEMNAVEAIGLLKLDLLGLANLTILQNALRIIRKTKGDEIDVEHLPLEDKKTFQLLARGDTIGVFQFASDGMQRYLKELKPNVIDDLIAMVALYRPGPMELIPQYIARKHGRESITYLIPELKPILQDTYGIAVYQEQVLQIARDIAGFTMGEADILRKAVGKKIKSLLLKQQKKFVDKAVARKVDKKIAEKLFEFIEPFARYGFNRAHATSYALVAYQTAYLKAHYPVEFIAALLTSDRDNLDKISVAIEEAKRLGITVMIPSVNESFEDFGVVPSAGEEGGAHGAYIRFGLSAIKNVGEGVAEDIVTAREQGGPWESLEDFLLRLSPKTVNKKTLESLIRSGALDGLGERGALLHNLDTMLYFSHSAHQNGVSSSQESLFGSTLNQTVKPHLKLEDTPAAEQRTRLAWEKELLGIYLSEHPLESYRGALERLLVVPVRELILHREGEVVSIAGIITSVQKIVTRSKEPMLFARFEDLNSATEVVVFPKTLRSQSDLWQVDTVLTVKGRISHKDGVLKIVAESAKPIIEHVEQISADAPEQAEKEVVLTLTEGTTRTILEELKKIFHAYPGLERVVLEFVRAGERRLVRTTERVTNSPEFIAALEKLGVRVGIPK
jgi:DNA polymerase-3 subunit alpha